MFKQLITFGKTTRLDINAGKSFFLGVSDSLKQVILRDTGFNEGCFPFTYLGVPLIPQRLLASQYSLLLHKLESSVQSWMGKHLTFAGRLEIVRSILYDMV
jgi:hypothetical protein